MNKQTVQLKLLFVVDPATATATLCTCVQEAVAMHRPIALALQFAASNSRKMLLWQPIDKLLLSLFTQVLTFLHTLYVYIAPLQRSNLCYSLPLFLSVNFIFNFDFTGYSCFNLKGNSSFASSTLCCVRKA